MDGHDRPVSDILAQELLPRTRRGLAAVGAHWQRAWVERHGADMRGWSQPIWSISGAAGRCTTLD